MGEEEGAEEAEGEEEADGVTEALEQVVQLAHHHCVRLGQSRLAESATA